MGKLKYFYSLCLLLILSMATFAQKDGYKIQVTLNGSQDTSLLLASYYGNTNQIADTAFLKNGKYVFEGKEKLNGGIYLVVFQNKQYLELIIDQEQYFSVETDPNDPVNKMTIKDSKDNKIFYEYNQKINKYGKRGQEINDELKELEDEKKEEQLKSELTKIGEDVKKLKTDIMEANPESLLAKVLLASREPETPTELPLKEDGSPDSSYIYKYYMAHYFDGFDFADERLLRSPVYASKIKRYWKKLLVQNPDTLIKEAVAIIEKAKPNKETYKFCIWYFTYDAEVSQIMGMDKVFVELGKRYYLTGEAFWISDRVLDRMAKRINTLDNLLIGKKAPNMIMQDTMMQLKSLYDTKAQYTIVLFWDPDCGHCKTEVKGLQQWYAENAAKYDAQVFAVCSDTNVVKWKKKIHEYKTEDWIHVDGPRSLTGSYHDSYDIISTPTIYLLDKDKGILAKRLNQKQTTEFIQRDYEYKLKKEKEAEEVKE